MFNPPPGIGLPSCLATAALCVALGGCVAFNRATNAPATGAVSAPAPAPTTARGTGIALSFSGGGLRAAAFSYGVLLGLQQTRTLDGDLLDAVDYISAVSGGALTAAYFGLYGRAGLAHYREQALLRDYESGMRTSLYNPANFLRLLGGGLNDRSRFAEVLDQHVFAHATFADLHRRRRPEVRINATDLNNRVGFTFFAPTFAALCSDLNAFAVSDAVAASMALPLVFTPVVVRSYPGRCEDGLQPWLDAALAQRASLMEYALARAIASYRDPERVQYVKLVDAGITDNYGLSTVLHVRRTEQMPFGLLSPQDAVRLRRLLFLLVDAGRSLVGSWSHSEDGPSGNELALGVMDASIDSAARVSAYAFFLRLHDWQEEIVSYRCALSPAQVQQLRGTLEGWDCRDIRLEADIISISMLTGELGDTVRATPTRLTGSTEQIDAAIEAGRRSALARPSLRTLAAP